MPKVKLSQIRHCWCGNDTLLKFSPHHKLCDKCQTLVLSAPAAQEDPHVHDDAHDFYGEQYWYQHQRELGYADIQTRARADLTERCQHWLQTLLRYKLPPGKVLELGCAHGGFVAMLRAAGFDATGLELSPTIVEFAKRTFGVPMLLGPIEEQQIEPGTLDAIVMMDVLEHLPDPLATLSRCAELLKPDGVLVAQTPRFPPEISYKKMVATRDGFLEQFKPQEHLYLFSEQSAAELFRRAGLGHTSKEPAMFAHYDMFLFAARTAPTVRTDDQVAQALLDSPRGRLALCWLDMHRQIQKMQGTLAEIEVDRAKRLQDNLALATQVREQQTKISQTESDCAKRLEDNLKLSDQVRQLQAQITEIDADRAKRLEDNLTLTDQVRQQLARISEIELDRAKRLEDNLKLSDQVRHLQAQIAEIETDRAKRLEDNLTLVDQVRQLQARIAEIEVDRAKRLEDNLKLADQVRQLQAQITEIDMDRAKRLEDNLKLLDQVRHLQAQITEIDIDRAKRLEDNLKLTAEILHLQAANKEIDADRAQRLEQIHVLTARIHELEQLPPMSAACGENPTQEAPK